MSKVDLKSMDVDALLVLRGDIDKELKERARDLQRQIALLGVEETKRRGRPPAGGARRVSALRGRSVPPKYRGPDGETWAGRGATPRWLSALVKEGHSVEEFLVGGSGKGRQAAAKKRVAKAKAARQVRKPRRRKEVAAEAESAET